MHILVPHFILDRFAAQEAEQGVLQAAAIFVDASGFTAATEALMLHGQHGAEVMANLMTDIFAPLVESVYAQGGFVAGFAGDAFTALFPIASDGDEAAVTERCVAAAQAIQTYMQQHGEYETVYGTFFFSVKVGVALGEAQWGILSGQETAGRTYYFRGTAVDRCAAAEHHANGGDLIMAREMMTMMGEGLVVETLSETEQFVRLMEVTRPLPAVQTVQLREPVRELAAAFHSPDLLDWELRGEFRQVLIMFVSLDEINTHEQLVVFMQTVFQLQGQYGGFFNRI
ncbi:MAG: adenylate/guanylate cyclase domain-containing protein, partial [Anaerolineales bacterium]|nr:adenylate/guanylate cyclase domain-containing protein [Anaerolineales bacterium]